MESANFKSNLKVYNTTDYKLTDSLIDNKKAKIVHFTNIKESLNEQLEQIQNKLITGDYDIKKSDDIFLIHMD